MNDFFDLNIPSIDLEEEEEEENRSVSLCETLDRVLNKGVVVAGEATISVAGIDLVYLGLHLMLTSVETARSWRNKSEPLCGEFDLREVS